MNDSAIETLVSERTTQLQERVRELENERGTRIQELIEKTTELERVQKILTDKDVRLNKTLARITPVLQRIALGDFSTGVTLLEDDEVDDEFAQIIVAIALVVEDLRESVRMQQEAEKGRLAAVEEKRAVVEKYSEKLEADVAVKTKELQSAKAHIEAIIENLTSGLVEYDHNLTIMRINRSAENMLGVSRDEMVGKRVKPEDGAQDALQSIVWVSYPGVAPGVKKIRKDISGFTDADVHNITIHRPLERELQIVTVPVLDVDTKQNSGFIKMLRDITREEVIARSKSEFISIAAHQLRTPLSAVKWSMKMIIDGDMGPLTKEQKDLLTRGYDTNQSMILLVNDLLNVARIEDGRFGYDFKKADLVDVISLVVHRLEILSKSHQVEIDFRNHAPELASFFFDIEKITIVVQNLLDNSIKYSNPGGKISIDLNVSGSYVVVAVSDRGIGIPHDQRDRIFTKFFRAKNATLMQTEGSGLGLFITKNIITGHGGTIAVESEEHKGTTFTFTLPTKEELLPKEEHLVNS